MAGVGDMWQRVEAYGKGWEHVTRAGGTWCGRSGTCGRGGDMWQE